MSDAFQFHLPVLVSVTSYTFSQVKFHGSMGGL